MPELNVAKKFHQLLKPSLPAMLSALGQIVLAESPSTNKRALDRCCHLIAKQWRIPGAQVQRIVQIDRGDHIRINWWPHESRPSGQLLILGHYDTVYASGTLREMPFRLSAGKAYGPGVFDMKAGIIQARFALEALRQDKNSLRKRLVFLWTSDEEIGSDSSRKLIEKEALRSDAVFVLEPAFGPRGALKTARKGVGEMEIVVHGRASHAGLAPQEGVNAIHELARQIGHIAKWNNVRRGITINANIIEGGTRTNVIAERARAAFDLRALRLTDMRQLEQRLRSLRAILPGSRLEILGGFDRPPLEHKRSVALFARAKTLAAGIGMSLDECTAGGGSDGNITAALGVPTLDGLGAVGDGAHTAREHIFIRSLPERAALLAALLSTA